MESKRAVWIFIEGRKVLLEYFLLASQGKLLPGEFASIFLASGKTSYLLVWLDVEKLSRPGTNLDLSDKCKIWAIHDIPNSFSLQTLAPHPFLKPHLEFKHIKLTHTCPQCRCKLLRSKFCYHSSRF